MTRVVLRCLAAVPTLVGVIVIAFLLTRVLPGDPAASFTSYPGMSAEDVARVRADMGLDAPLYEQFLLYIRALLNADLGQSFVTGQPVLTELKNRLPATAELTVYAFSLALLMAIVTGVASALRPGSIIDRLCRLMAGLGVALPTFVTALILIYLFYFRFDIVPEPTGRIDPFMSQPRRITGFLTIDAVLTGNWQALKSVVAHLFLPVLTMALFAFGPLMRMMRGTMITVMRAEFIHSAHALGLPRRQIVMTYAFRNAILPVITLSGITLSYMIAANVLVETVFAWPGIGVFALDSLMALDYAPVQGFLLVVALIFVVLNLLTDLIAGMIDPRAGLT